MFVTDHNSITNCEERKVLMAILIDYHYCSFSHRITPCNWSSFMSKLSIYISHISRLGFLMAPYIIIPLVTAFIYFYMSHISSLWLLMVIHATFKLLVSHALFEHLSPSAYCMHLSLSCLCPTRSLFNTYISKVIFKLSALNGIEYA